MNYYLAMPELMDRCGHFAVSLMPMTSAIMLTDDWPVPYMVASNIIGDYLDGYYGSNA